MSVTLSVTVSLRSLELARTGRTALLKALVPGQSGGSTRNSIDAWLVREPDSMAAVRSEKTHPLSCPSAFRGSPQGSRQFVDCRVANSRAVESTEQREHHQTIRLTAW